MQVHELHELVQVQGAVAININLNKVKESNYYSNQATFNPDVESLN